VVCGEERYDSNDIDTLIEQYRQARDRKNGNEQALVGKEV
jgi:hypothetical protein